MNAGNAGPSRIIGAVLLIGLILFRFPGSTAFAENAQENLTPSLVAPSSQADQSLLNRRLKSARKDMEAFRSFADSFRNGGETVALAQLQAPVDAYLQLHVDNLLPQVGEYSTLESNRLAAEAMSARARLMMSLKREDAGRNVVAEIKKRFSTYQKITVDLSGRTTTLDEGIRILEEELAAAEKAAKK